MDGCLQNLLKWTSQNRQLSSMVVLLRCFRSVVDVGNADRVCRFLISVLFCVGFVVSSHVIIALSYFQLL